MRLRIVVVASIVAVLTPTASLVGASPALAETCSGPGDISNIQFAGSQWTHFHTDHFDVNGVRAPVEFRNDGALCDFSQYNGNSAYTAWIAIQSMDTNVNTIVQAGVLTNYNTNGSVAECTFWAKGAGLDHVINCNPSNDTDYYFQIHTYNNGTEYVISYCGTGGGFTNCQVEDSSQPVIPDPEGEVQIEGHYSCALHNFGNSSDQLNIGNSNYHVQGLTDDGQWIARTWGIQSSECPDWNNSQNNSGETMRFYDTRNAH